MKRVIALAALVVVALASGGCGDDDTMPTDGAIARTDAGILGGDAGPPRDGGGGIDAGGAADAGVVPIPTDAIYVDGTLGASTCTDYAPETRVCGSGSRTAFRTLAAGADAATAGATVVIRGGTFTDEQLIPVHAGTAAMPITFRGAPGETATLTLPGGRFVPAIFIADSSYLVIQDIQVENAPIWAQVVRSNHVVFRGVGFTTARDMGSRGGVRFVDSDLNRVESCTFDDGNDNLFFENSNRNVVTRSTFRTARHTLLVVSCSNRNVIRDNDFTNSTQKGIETFDCEGTIESLYDDTLQVRRLDATKRNVWEGNRFTGTPASTRMYDYNAMQYSGQQGITRRNVFYGNLGGGIGIAVYADEALATNRNHIYANTAVDNGCFGIWAPNDSEPGYFGNVVVNNVFFGNTDCSGSGSNDIVDDSSGGVVRFGTNVTSDPGLVDRAGRDFHLADGSAAIDAGELLAHARTAGSGTTLAVDDAGFFYDGYGIEGEVGDTIRVQSSGATAIVTAVDDATNTLTLDRSLTWTAGDGISLDYLGTRPDVGAFEHP